jgi:hypothetical protein
MQAIEEQAIEELKTAELSGDVHQEAIPAPGVEYVEVTNHNRDIEVGLKNGFQFALRMGAYGGEALRNYELLPANKRETFLKMRAWLMQKLAVGLSGTYMVPGTFYMIRDTIYYAGKHTEGMREIYQNHMQRPTKENLISIMRTEPWTYQPRDWSVPQATYRAQTYDLYYRTIKTFDEQLVRMSGILNIYNKQFTENWFDVAIVMGMSARGGRTGAGKTPPLWMSLRVDWANKSLLWRPYGESERSILGQSFSLPSIRIGYSRAGADPTEREKTMIEGQNYQPWGPFSFTVTGDRTTVYLSYDFLSIFAMAGAYAAGAPPWMIILGSFAPAPAWLMSSVGRVTRSEFYDGSLGLTSDRRYANRLPGHHVARGIIVSIFSYLSDKGRATVRNAKLALSVLRNPAQTLERVRENRRERDRNYRPRSCNLIFNGPIPVATHE